MISEIDKGHYGFIHMRELPEGKYLMLGSHSRGYNMLVAGGGYIATVYDGEKETGIAFEFEVEAGKVSYLGELLTFDGNLKNSSIRLSRKKDRDISYAVKKYPLLDKYEIVDVAPEAVKR